MVQSIKLSEIIKPTNNLEKELFDTITKIKNISNISITDDFFEDLNFDSLDIMQMSTLLSKYNVSIQSINNNSSIQKLAQSINNKNDKSTINVFHEVEIQNHTFSYDLNNVLLTGSTGFLGAHILRDLKKNPNKFQVYMQYYQRGRGFIGTKLGGLIYSYLIEE